MIRLFVGIALPPEQKLALSLICSGLPGAKWVDPGNLHVTLRFIGEQDEGMAADIDAALAAIRLPRFFLTIAGTDVFGERDKPRMLYAGLDPAPALVRLNQKIETALIRLGLPPEGRRYTPHVTLARFQRAHPVEVARFVAAHNLLRLPAFEVEAFQLNVSMLSRSGAIYEDVAAYPLV
jgi:2'-5' RNA ligase